MKSLFFKITGILTVLVTLTPNSLFAHFGPRSPLGGKVTCGTSYNGIIYFGTENGGVFEATNNQNATWRPRPVGMHSGKITAIVHSGNYLFAGTADSGIYIFNGFVGSDRYWNRVNNGLGNLQIKSLVAIDTITILAGTNGGGLYKTTNKGATWTAINDNNLNGMIITSLAKAGNRYFASTLTGGVFVSDDFGMTWDDFNDINTLNIAGTQHLSYNNTTDELIVLNNDGLFITDIASTATNPVYLDAYQNLPISTQIRSISNNGSNWYIATNIGVFSSVTGTIDWIAGNSGLSNLNTTTVVAISNAVVTSVWKQGIFKADPAVMTWSLTNAGFNNLKTHSFTAKGDTTVVTANENGVFVSLGTGVAATYVSSNTGLIDSLNVNDIIFADNLLVAATTNGGIYTSSNMGANWSTFNTGLSELNFSRLFYANDRIYVISATNSIYSTPVTGANWTLTQSGLPGGIIPTSFANFGNKIILGTLGNGVFIRADETSNWVAFNSGLSNLNVTSVAASNSKVYAGTNGYGVFISDLSTANWSSTSQTSIPHTTMIGLNGNNIQAMASNAGYVYASYLGGLLATSDNGATWEEGGNQFNLPSFTNVNKIGFVTTRVFVSTDNNGPYSNSLSELPTLPNFLSLSENMLSVPENANSNYITITSNVPWTILSNDSWLSANTAAGKGNGNFRIDAQTNTGSTRIGTITVSSDSLPQILTITVTQTGSVGISENKFNASDINIFPNPNNGIFTIDMGSNTDVQGIELYDVSGKLLVAYTNNTTRYVTISCPLNEGIYFVHIRSESGMTVKKVIIE